jgi:hypothetical protein
MPQNTVPDTEQLPERAEELNERRPKPINTTAHAVLDYTLSPTLAFAPQTFGFPTRGPASWVPRAYGMASLVYSPMTRYELAPFPVLPMRAHLMIDLASSVFMAASPWVFGFGKARRKRSWLPHLLFAISELAIVVLSDDRSKA